MGLSPQDQSLISKYRLLPRRKGLGVQGERLSQNQGVSSEFRDFREYAEGDDLRNLDWNVLARLGQRVVRTYQDEQEMRVTLILDGTASMHVGSGEKWATASTLGAALGTMALQGGDALQSFAIGPDGSVRNLRGYGSVGRWNHWIQNLKTDVEASSFRKGCEAVASRLSQPGLTIVVSDLLEQDAEESMLALLHRRQELWLVQVLTRDELEPDLHGDLELVDVDSGLNRVCTITDDVSREYRQNLAAHTDILVELAQKSGGKAMRVLAGQDLAETLRNAWRPQRWVG